MNQLPPTGATPTYVTIGSGPAIPETDPITIRRELVARVDKLADVRVRKVAAEVAVDAARGLLDRVRADAQAAEAAVRELEQRESAEIEALATAGEADGAVRRLAATRVERGMAVTDLESKRLALAAASGASNGPANELAGLISDESRYLREIDMWRNRAAAHPLPAPTRIEPSTITSFADSVAAANNFPNARAMHRSQFLASLPADVRAVVEADSSALDACLDRLAIGDTTGAIGAAYAAHVQATVAVPLVGESDDAAPEPKKKAKAS